jgi:hypothetical protein
MRKRYDTFTTGALDKITAAYMAEFELSEKETKEARREIYRINKDGIRKFRTMRDGPLLLIWRIK